MGVASSVCVCIYVCILPRELGCILMKRGPTLLLHTKLFAEELEECASTPTLETINLRR